MRPEALAAHERALVAAYSEEATRPFAQREPEATHSALDPVQQPAEARQGQPVLLAVRRLLRADHVGE